MGNAEYVQRLRRHPLAHALRVDKLTLAALEATVLGPVTPTHQAMHADSGELLARAARLAEAVNERGVGCQVVPNEAVTRLSGSTA